MTLSCTEAIQSVISHFNQYSLVDPSWGNIPSWVWQEGWGGVGGGGWVGVGWGVGGGVGVGGWGGGVAIDLQSSDAEFDTTVNLETEFHEINNIFISHPDKHTRNWKIVSTINVTYALIN